MIKKLRRKFIGVTMLALIIVMAVLTFAINAVNFRNVNLDINRKLDMLCSNGGNFPSTEAVGNAPPDNGGMLGGRLDFFGDPEARYKLRFFSVCFDESGLVTASNTASVAAVTDAEAQELAREAYASGKARSYDGSYKYMVYETDGGAVVVFVDCTDELSNVRTLLVISFAAAFLSTLAVFALVLLFSGRAIAPVAQSVEKQKQFITDAEHELKTPITIVSSNAQILEMDYGKNEWLTGIQNQVERMQNLVGSMISLSRLDEEQPAMDIERFSISEAVQDTAAAFRAVAEGRGESLSLDIQPELLYRGDEAQIRKLVSVLTDNAVKYCSPGGDIRVVLTGGRRICLEVTNSFSDPASMEMDRLFDRFYRADKSRSRKSGSYGLGLSIAKSVVEAHHGKISAASRDGQSVTFSVVL